MEVLPLVLRWVNFNPGKFTCRSATLASGVLRLRYSSDSPTKDDSIVSTMPSMTASPAHWTLRFKHHKSTTLLHVDPLQSFATIKAELIHALNDVYHDGRLPSGLQIPESPSDILLGKAKDHHDLTRGFERISTNQVNGDEEGQTSNKKKRNDPIDCPKGAGLRDGSAVAYRFRSEDLDLDEGLGLDDEDEKWDVVVATFEESAEGGIPRLPPFAE